MDRQIASCGYTEGKVGKDKQRSVKAPYHLWGLEGGMGKERRSFFFFTYEVVGLCFFPFCFSAFIKQCLRKERRKEGVREKDARMDELSSYL